MIHAALVAQGMLHMRSAPLAAYLQKSFYFAGERHLPPSTA